MDSTFEAALNGLKELSLERVGRDVVTEAAVLEFERLLGLKLPPDYRHFLKCHCPSEFEQPVGYRPQERTPWTPQDGLALLDCFLGLTASERDDADIRLALRRHAERLPSEYLPIALAPGGNLVCLSLWGDSAGMVFFWDHEAAQEKDIYIVARAFVAFLESFEIRAREEDLDAPVSMWLADDL